MGPTCRYRLRWARWLAYQGLPPAHICALLGLDRVELEGLLAIPRRSDYREGPPHRGVPGVPGVRGAVASKARLLARLGYDAGRIAAILAVRRAAVVDFLGRTTPLRKPRDGSGELARPRSRAEQRRLVRRSRRKPPPPPVASDPWGYRDNSPRRAPAPAIAAVEATEPGEPDRAEGRVEAPGPAPATSPGGWGADWGMRRPRGSRHGAAALDDEQAAEVRRLRGQGLERRELAAMFGVSVATVTRITSGRGYADPPPSPPVAPDPVGAPAPPPAPSPVPAAAPGDWRHFGGAPSRPGPRRRKAPAEST